MWNPFMKSILIFLVAIFLAGCEKDNQRDYKSEENIVLKQRINCLVADSIDCHASIIDSMIIQGFVTYSLGGEDSIQIPLSRDSNLPLHIKDSQ